MKELMNGRMNERMNSTQVFISLSDKANKELKDMAAQLEAVRRASAAAQATGGGTSADMHQMTNAMYIRCAEIKVRSQGFPTLVVCALPWTWR